MKREEFLLPVIQRNTGKNGRPAYADILRRMDNPVCKKCHEEYQLKYPGRPFHIVCQGIYDEVDIQKTAEDKHIPEEDVRDILDPIHWASKHIRVTNESGDILPFTPRDYQEGVLSCTARRKVDRMGRGLGKRLNINTPIPTPLGWSTMGDLKVGDYVFAADGRPTRVSYVSPILLAYDTYNVVFSDGSVIHADAEHLWETIDKKTRKDRQRYPNSENLKNQPTVITTKGILDTLEVGNKKEKNHAVRLALPIKLPYRKLPVAPYVLGVWLGAGSSNVNQLTCNDPEIIEEIKWCGFSAKKLKAPFMYTIGGQPEQRNKKGQYQANNSLKNKLDKLGVLNNKHIPKTYLRGSIHQRLSLLQGLMDTDGSIFENGTSAEFCNVNKQLAEQVYELICSLGMKAVLTESNETLYGRVVGLRYRIQFFPTLPVFRLTRKLERQKQAVRPTVWHRYIVEVRKANPALMRCIQVDNEEHLYLVGKSFIPTHNTLLGVIEELHKVTTKKNYEILILCPAKAQAQMWFDQILWQCEQDPELSDTIKAKRQQPYFRIEFQNDSKLSIFTAGSSSGRDADVIRSQSPRRVRLEEQDLLNDGDYKAVMPLLRRYPNSEFHGASTPTGARSQFWSMCRQFSDYREFYEPISVHPGWSVEMEEACRREARTEDVYRHEFLAEFGDLAQGVFKSYYIDLSRVDYIYKQCHYIPKMKYFMGVDWNGQGTGTRIRVVEYDPETKVRRCVETAVVDGPQTTTQDSIDRIRDINRYWHCEDICIDKGFGNVQDEMLRLVGKKSKDLDDKRLMELKVIDFGAEMKTNKLVPNRGNTKYLDKEEDKRRTKPFMVEGAVMVLEQGLFKFSSSDSILDSQFRAYKIKTWSQHGFANTYDAGREGDHDLDAIMLALLGVELKYGLTAVPREQRLAQWAHVTEVGGGPSDPVADAKRVAEARERAKEISDVPTRQMPPKEDDTSPKVVLPGKLSHIIIPGRARSGRVSRVPSRTSAFRQPDTGNKVVPSRTHPLGPIRNPANGRPNPFDTPYIAPRPGKER